MRSSRSSLPLVIALLTCAFGSPVAFGDDVIRAQVQPRRYTTLSAEVSAKIVRLPLAEGDRFAVGDLLVQFDDSLQRAQLQRAEAELAAARVVLHSNSELEKLSSVGKVEIEQSRFAVARAEAEVAAAGSLLGKCRVVAPFPGRVAEQMVRELEFVQLGQPLLEIIDDTQLDLEFIVPSRLLAGLGVDTPLSATIDETGRNYPARIRRIGARVEPVSQTAKVVAAIDGQFPELLAGMSGRVHLPPPTSRQP